MARVMLTARVTETQAAVLRSYADEAGLSLYQATVRAIELGIAAFVAGRSAEPASPDHPAGHSEEIAALREGIERLTVRAELSDAVTQRTLFAAGAAYAASLAVAGQGASPERLAQIKDEIARDSYAIFERQLAMARGE
nr:hypothetical protein TQ38_28020 [Novosphingobium sp. P6W]